MLYEKLNGKLQPTAIQPKQVRALTADELTDVRRNLMEIIRIPIKGGVFNGVY